MIESEGSQQHLGEIFVICFQTSPITGGRCKSAIVNDIAEAQK